MVSMFYLAFGMWCTAECLTIARENLHDVNKFVIWGWATLTGILYGRDMCWTHLESKPQMVHSSHPYQICLHPVPPSSCLLSSQSKEPYGGRRGLYGKLSPASVTRSNPIRQLCILSESKTTTVLTCHAWAQGVDLGRRIHLQTMKV